MVKQNTSAALNCTARVSAHARESNLVWQRHDVAVLARIDVDDVETVTRAQVVGDARERRAASLGHAVINQDCVVDVIDGGALQARRGARQKQNKTHTQQSRRSV